MILHDLARSYYGMWIRVRNGNKQGNLYVAPLQYYYYYYTVAVERALTFLMLKVRQDLLNYISRDEIMISGNFGARRFPRVITITGRYNIFKFTRRHHVMLYNARRTIYSAACL